MTRNSEVLAALATRASTPSRLLGEPGPDPATLEAMLSLALRVPDHGRLTPWRYLLIEGEARHRLSDCLLRRFLEREPAAAETAIAKERQRFLHAPLIVTVIARTSPAHKIPVQEQLLSAGTVCFQLLLAAQAHGYGAQWLTGWAAYDPAIASALGLAEHECVVGFIHIGTPREAAPERARPALADHLSRWTGPCSG
ncbi:MAG: nitroreductase [Xanthomonadales bacterium]|jgi:nitroreductase|nr:nitroreductase [Xanthomonadales bacterium]